VKWILLLLFLCILSSCKSTENTDAKIRIRLEEYSTGNGTSVQIPEFYSENEQLQQSIHELERETKKLRRIYEKAKKNKEHLEMRCYVSDTEGFPQVTVVWYTAEEDTRTYNLTTLCADEKEGLPVTCREALVRTGMRGVDLSLQVGKLAQEADLRGEISSMEMQGFRIDETGIVRETLSLLGDRDKQVLYLYFWKELPQAEIAKRLDIPVGTVKSGLNRARSALQKKLNQHADLFARSTVSKEERRKPRSELR